MAVQRDKIIANAEKLVAKGKIEAAIKEYDRLLDDNPNDVNTLNRVGDLWTRINRTDEAVKVFGRIADHYSKDGFFLKAIAIYKKINKIDPSKLDVYSRLAELYAKQGLAMEAKSQYQVLADYYLKHGDVPGALSTYKRISELDPNSINVHVKLADLHSQIGQNDEALKEYDRVGRMLLKRGMLDEAVQVFRKALKIDASNLELAESLVTSLLESNDATNAIQLLEISLEKNRENPRLLALLGRAWLAKGDLSEAGRVLERGLASNPTDTTIRETLADLLLRRGEVDRALDLVNPMVDSAIEHGQGRAAIDLLNRILRVDASHIPTLSRLVNVFTRLREDSNVLMAMNNLAEAHIARKDFAEAAPILRELVQREPDNEQTREKLAFVSGQLGERMPGVAAPPPPPPAPSPAPEPEPAAFSTPEPAGKIAARFDLDLDQGEISLELDGPELDLSFDESPPLMQPDLIHDGPPSAPAGPPQTGAEDLEFITEHLTEAEVFGKYGLIEKATEHIRSVLHRYPRHVPALEKLLQLALEEGDRKLATSTAATLMPLLQSGDDHAALGRWSDELTRHQIPIGAPASAEPSPPPPAPSAEAEIDFGFVPPPGADDLVLEVMHEDEVELEVEFDPEELLEPEPEKSGATMAAEPEVQPASLEQPAGAALPAFDFEDLDLSEATERELPSFDFDAEEAEIEFDDIDLVSPAAEPPPSGPPVGASPAAEELGEVDFYIEQELFDEAGERLLGLEARFPGNRELSERRQRLQAVDTRAAAEPAPPMPISPVDIESELLSAIPEDDDEIRIVESPTAASAAPADESSLFSDEDDFFDLAAELENELEEEESSISLSEEEQSLEEIFREFKKGVEQQLDSEDYETHYNLGIAYKEMGLTDEAIGEFQLASKDPKRTIECCSMLGLCFLEKGMPQLAIKWYRKGLELPEITEEEQLGLLYDLGSAYLEVGDVPQAEKAFMDIYGIKSSYRDVVSRLRQVEDVRRA
jgi:tetratricopeptide (TPR) repeat protein